MELTGIIRERTFYTDSGLQAMSDIAGQLAETNRYFMYYTNRRDDAVPAFVLNLLVGSLESWVQTDFASAVIQDILYVGGLSAVLTAPLFNDRQTSMAVMWSGVGVIGCAWLIGVVTPWTFENHWNTRLASGLNVHIGR